MLVTLSSFHLGLHAVPPNKMVASFQIDGAGFLKVPRKEVLCASRAKPKRRKYSSKAVAFSILIPTGKLLPSIASMRSEVSLKADKNAA